MNEATTFEDIADDGFGALEGGSENVLANAFITNTGAALTEYDLFGEGRYPIHSVPGVYTLFVQKDNKNQITFITGVEDFAMKSWEEDRANDLAMNEIRGADQRCKSNIPMWILAELMFIHDVTPEDGYAFEKAVKTHYPKCWLSD